jgi:hypothetical protein
MAVPHYAAFNKLVRAAEVTQYFRVSRRGARGMCLGPTMLWKAEAQTSAKSPPPRACKPKNLKERSSGRAHPYHKGYIWS